MPLPAMALVSEINNLPKKADGTPVSDSEKLNWIEKSTAFLYSKCGRRFMTESYTETITGGGGFTALRLDNYPIRSLISITIDDEEIDLTDVKIISKSGILYREEGWGTTFSVIVIEYSSGYSLEEDDDFPLPQDLHFACIDLVKFMYHSNNLIAEEDNRVIPLYIRHIIDSWRVR